MDLPSYPQRLRLMRNNELWQCHDDGVTVLNTELRPLREIESKSDSGDMGVVYDVAALPDGDVAVAGTNGLFVMDHEGKYIYQVWMEKERESYSGDMGWVYDVAGLPDGDVAVAGWKEMFLIANDCKYIYFVLNECQIILFHIF